MTARIAPPPADLVALTGFQGKKWLESLSQQGADVATISGLQFLLLVNDASLPNARKLTAGPDIGIDDGGAGSNLTLLLLDSPVSPGTFTQVTVDQKGRITAGANITTSGITEGSNLYFTNARARLALSGTVNQVIYDNLTGVIGTPQDIAPTSSPSFTKLALKAGSSTGFTAKSGGVIFDHYSDVGNVNTTEVDLYSDTLLADTLAVNGDKIFASYSGLFEGSASDTRQIRIYFAGTVILDTTALSVPSDAAWTVDVTLIRVSSTVVRYKAEMRTPGATLTDYLGVGEVTGLTLSGTNILKITGQSAGVGVAANDIVAKMGLVEWRSAA